MDPRGGRGGRWTRMFHRGEYMVPACDTPSDRIVVQLVVVTAFPPEISRWVARFPLPEAMPFPHGAEPSREPLHINRASGVLGVTTGMGPSRAAASLSALGHDDRFDFRAAYWLVAGIAGVDPAFGSIGSVVVPHFLVDLGGAYYLDGIGNIPEERTLPDYDPPYPSTATAVAQGRLVVLNRELAELAVSIAGPVPLNDSATLVAARQSYTEAAARQPPVLRGGGVSATGETFWAGRRSNDYARNASRFFTGGAAPFAVTQEEDHAYAEALASLGRDAAAPLANVSRLLVLRAASDFAYEPPHEPLSTWFFDDPLHMCTDEALDGLYASGSAIVRVLAPARELASPPTSPRGARARPLEHDGLTLSWPWVALIGAAQLLTLATAMYLFRQLRWARSSWSQSSTRRWVELANDTKRQPSAATVRENGEK